MKKSTKQINSFSILWSRRFSTWARKNSNLCILQLESFLFKQIFGIYWHFVYYRLLVNVIKSSLRSLGCVIYELLFLKVAFPRGQFANPEIPDLGNTLFFSRILKKYYFVFKHIFKTIFIWFLSLYCYRMLKKEWKKRITSESLYDILTVFINRFVLTV